MAPRLDQIVVNALAKASDPMTVRELAEHLHKPVGAAAELREALRELEGTGRVRQARGGRWELVRKGKANIVGRLEVTSRGFGFVRPERTIGDSRENDVFVPEGNMGAALDGDRVGIEVVRNDERGLYGRVVEVLDHAHPRIVGWYQQTGKMTGEVHPRNKRIGRRIMTTRPPAELNLRDFEWVSVEITDYTTEGEPMRGKVVERLGADSDRGIDVLLLLRDRGIVEEFPLEVTREAAAIQVDWKVEIARRRDLRGVQTITIDPLTAKDFDDALSIERKGAGWTLFVHIADVAHFVRPGTPLDRAAQDRSTSVYPVDRVVPMLPERLSNDLCSLRPDEDRLAVTAEIDFDSRGNALAGRYYDSVIRSDFRLAYEQVQTMFDGSDAALSARYTSIAPMLAELRALAKLLRGQRIQRGALDLDIPQVQVIFDAAGKVSDLRFYPRFEAHKLIEECMIAANEAVARELTARSAPMLYRIHEPADDKRLEQLEPVLKAFGIRVGLSGGRISSHALQAALQQAEKMRHGHIVRRLILRSLKRAVYSERHAGHFGLASECYCHFTSPIRRYPNVIVHRQIKALAEKTPLVYPNTERGVKDLAALATSTSVLEREAEDAEREAVTIKSLEFMLRHEGDEFAGVISGVQNYGIFVELEPYPVEGHIPIREIPGDRYDLDDLGITLVGRRSGRQFRLGQDVRVQIMRVDPMKQEMDLKLLVEGLEKPIMRGHRQAPKKHKKKRR